MLSPEHLGRARTLQEPDHTSTTIEFVRIVRVILPVEYYSIRLGINVIVSVEKQTLIRDITLITAGRLFRTTSWDVCYNDFFIFFQVVQTVCGTGNTEQ